MKAPRILYFAHDLDDTAIWRRVSMLEAGGARVAIVGFRRGTGALPREDAITLGRTKDGKMVQRMVSVMSNGPGIANRLRAAGLFDEGPPDVVLARNLEMLMLARAALRRMTPRPTLVYELLDIHRLQIGSNRIGRTIRAVERNMIRACDQVVVSSPGFVTHYLEPRNMGAKNVMLWENKVFRRDASSHSEDTDVTTRAEAVETGRVTIGWFGILRCAWSLDTLDRLSRSRPGRFRIVLRGKPAMDQLPDFHDRVAANPDMSFGGPYRWPDNLADIYGSIDIAWLIDKFDSDGNSRWLLPNRLYEGCLYGAAPVAIAPSEVGAKLSALDCGIVLPEGTWEHVAGIVGEMSPEDVRRARRRVARLPRDLWFSEADDCRSAVHELVNAKESANQA